MRLGKGVFLQSPSCEVAKSHDHTSDHCLSVPCPALRQGRVPHFTHSKPGAAANALRLRAGKQVSFLSAMFGWCFADAKPGAFPCCSWL